MNYVLDQFTNRYGEQEGTILHKKFSANKNNAKKRGIAVNFEWTDIDLLAKPLLGHGLCDYTSQPFGDDDMKPTFERIDSSKGYIRGNVCIVTQIANHVKNYIYDLPQELVTFSPKHKEAIRQMFDTCTGDYMEQLKSKYVPKAGNKETERLEEHELEIIQKYSEPVVEETPAEIPEDIILAEKYATWLRFMIKSGFDVTLTFFEFKLLIKAKRCFITGKELDDSKQPVLFDQKGKVEKANVKFANGIAAEALNNLVDKSGMTVQELVSNLKKTVK